MAKFNKRGEMKGTTIAFVLVGLLVLAYFANFNGFKDWVSGMGQTNTGTGTSSGSSPVGGQPTPTTTVNCPSTGKTDLTINTQDDLATTATNVIAEYIVFNGNKLIKEGTTPAGTATVSLTCGQDFKILLVNTTTGNGNGLYPKIVDYPARIASDSINARLAVTGTAKILSIENPADPSRNPNATIVAGGTKNFDLKFTANHTARAVNRPLIMCQVNTTAISDIVGSTFSDGTSVVEITTLPKRLSAGTGGQYYGFEYPKILTPAMGVVTLSGTITGSSNPPGGTESMNCSIIDQGMWKTASYKTAESIDAGFKTGPENTETNADVGGPDTASSPYWFAGSY